MSVNLKQSMLDYYRERAIEYDDVYQGKGPASISEPKAYISEVAILSDIVTRTLSGNIIDIACGTAFWRPMHIILLMSPYWRTGTVSLL